MSISVAIVEDDISVRNYLTDAIRESPLCKLEGVAHNSYSANELIKSKTADVFLVDLGLPDGSGIDIIKQIVATQPSSQCMVLSAFGDVRHIITSFEAGATGYIHKSEMPADIISKIVQLFNGTSPVSSNVAKLLIQKAITKPTKNSNDISRNQELREMLNLSKREMDILNALTSNLSVKEIASSFDISKHTVNQHLRNIYSKLGVHSRISAINEFKKYESS
jgi:DNA-binding NarL/FixJ family response regulator